MSWGWRWKPYVPVAKRRANAARELAKMTKRGGAAAPVVIEGRTIASTFWGKAWCENLESYSDFANRLPRGRTYVRNGSVMDLQIAEGKVTALVCGSSLYKIKINIKPLSPPFWKRVQAECAGKIDSLIELLQGRLSAAVMQVVTRPRDGLFPKPAEIDMECSCPDSAGLCKHLAAVLYGAGARLDQKPDLLFLLRGVAPAEVISKASAAEAIQQTSQAAPALLGESELADVFGIELETAAAPAKPGSTPGAKKKTSRTALAKPTLTKSAQAKSKPSAKTRPKAKTKSTKKSGASRRKPSLPLN
jgi:uncharacterized Zn finger protein